MGTNNNPQVQFADPWRAPPKGTAEKGELHIRDNTGWV